MNDTSKILSIIAFYLSEYDIDAVRNLGYHSRAEAFKKLSTLFNRDNNYLKLRRDEFDVLTNSHRYGWRNRKPANEVLSMAEYLKSFSFDEITLMVESMIENVQPLPEVDANLGIFLSGREVTSEFTEEEFEQIINYEDPTANLIIHAENTARRIYRKKIVEELKRLYKFQCQICGYSYYKTYGENLAEVHHIESFSKSHNNNARNLIVLCPNHHRIIHRLNPVFDRTSLTWNYSNGVKESLILNYHL